MISEPQKGLFLPQMKKIFTNLITQTLLQSKHAEISAKHDQESMKLWWIVCRPNATNFSRFRFILEVVQTWLTK